MKKKIFLTLALALAFVCLLMISASAKTIISENNLDENGDIVADFKYLVKADYYYCTVDITYNDVDGNQREGQFVYYTGGLYGGKLQLLGVYIPQDFDFSQTIYLFDKVDSNGDGSFSSSEYLKGSNGGTNAMHWHSYESFDGATGKFSSETINVKPLITTLSYSKYMTYFGHYFMPCADSLTTVTYNGKEPVEGTVFISPSINEVMSNTFGGEGNNSQNRDEPNYTRLVFEERTGSVSLQQYAFCRVVLEEIVFLGGTYHFRNDSIAYVWAKGTSDPCLERIVVSPETVLKTNPISWNVGNYDIVYIGTEGEYAEHMASGNLTSLSNATGNVTYEDICYVYGHEASEHDGLCTSDVVCLECGDVLEEALYDTHNDSVIVKYENGYLSAGYKRVGCSRCSYGTTVVLDPLFICLGYSAPETGRLAISLGFKVNNAAIAEYKEITGADVKYGVFAASFDKLGNGDIFENGVANANAICAEIKATEFAVFDLKITGFTDAQKDAPLALGAYVSVTKDEATEYSYMQDETKGERVGNYIFASYNNITG